ncbi:enoyl-CoA hydratase/isomerase family protein [Myxococcus sp. XM-1-1-1]|nr:enoyl-CoA hydratase/isomerase family protein [Myxococcus sp. XM-1-1-1]
MTVQAMSVLLEVDDGVATLTMNDAARRNAMTPELGIALRERVEELRGRSDVRAVLLTGAGGTFSAGGDLQMLDRLRQVPFEEARLFMLEFYSRYLCLLDLPVPTIAAVEGAAIGAGLCVALACDLVITSEDAKLALNFVQLGLHPGMGATFLVPLRAGPQRAAELLLTGRRFDGREAARLGLTLEATPADQTRTRASTLARTIASNAPLATRGLKQRLGLDRAALRRALEEEARLQAESYGSADLGEGLAAAAARRPPVFHGR